MPTICMYAECAMKTRNRLYLVVLHKLRRDAMSKQETPRDFSTMSAHARPQSLKQYDISGWALVTGWALSYKHR